MNGSTVKNHISLKTGFGYNATRRTSFGSWFQAGQRVRPAVLISQLRGHLQDMPDCLVAQVKQLTQYLFSNVKMEDAPKLLKIPKSECPDILDPCTTTQMA